MFRSKKYKYLGLLFFIGAPFAMLGQRPEGFNILNLPDTQSIRKVMDCAKKMEEQNPDSASILYLNVLSQSQKIGYRTGILRAYTELAISAAKSAQYNKAIVLARKGIMYCDTVSDLDVLATLYNCMGNVYDYQALYELAFQAYYKAAYYARKNPERSAAVYANMAKVLRRLGQPDKALWYIDKALGFFTPSANPELHVTLLFNKGNCLNVLKRYKQACDYWDSTIDLARRYRLHVLSAFAISIRANRHTEADQPHMALSLLQQEAPKLLKDPAVQARGKSTLWGAMGLAYMYLKQYAKAEQYYEKALAIAVPQDQGYLAMQLTDLYVATGQYKKAYTFYRSYKEKEDMAGSNAMRLRVNALEVQYRTLQKDNELALRSLQLANKQKVISQQHSLIILLIAGIVLVAVLLLWRYRYLNRKHRHERELNRIKNVFEGEEKERSRLARELHDHINSQLAAAQAHLTAGQKAHPFLVEDKHMNTAQHLLQHTAESVRRVAHNMAPYHLQSLGLENAIKLFYQNLFADAQVQTEVTAYGDFQTVETNLVLTIYRIAQELGQNVKKHAAASRFLLMLCRTDDEITLTAEDNGKGFDVRSLNRKDSQGSIGIGLSGMQERLKIYDGTMEINASPQDGTTIHMRFPYR